MFYCSEQQSRLECAAGRLSDCRSGLPFARRTVPRRGLEVLPKFWKNSGKILSEHMNGQTKHLYVFGPFRFDPEERLLLRDGRPVPLAPKAVETLLLLVQNAGHLVDKDDLVKRVWPDAFVEEGNLNKNIFVLRKALGQWDGGLEYIETVPKRGYRFIGAVNQVMEVEPGSQPQPPAVPNLINERTSPSCWKIVTPISLLLIAGLLAGGLFWHSRQRRQPFTEKDTIVLADFDNKTGETAFDDTLKQALAVDIEQSPLLRVLSDRRVAHSMQMMGRSPAERLSTSVAEELCQRVGSKAIVAGSIANLGGEYIVGLKATDCATGDSLAVVQARASSKANVIKALDQEVASLRGRLGESLNSVQKFATPVEEATTPSLEALHAYSLGVKTFNTTGLMAALPLFKRAVELDSRFAMAYANMGSVYADLGEWALARENERKAYDLREKVSERERLFIESHYYSIATGEHEKAVQVYELWQRMYPRDPYPYMDLGTTYSILGWYDKALDQYREALRLDPDMAGNYLNLGECWARLNRLDQAEAVYKQAEERKLEAEALQGTRYGLAFLKGDVGEMARLVTIATGKAGAEDMLLTRQADTEAFSGRLKMARKLERRAIELAKHNGDNETAAYDQVEEGLWEAEFGFSQQARVDAGGALRPTSNQAIKAVAAVVLARAGDGARALEVVNKLNKDFPLDTMIQGYWIPTARAAIELSHGRAANAIELLQATSAYELGANATMYPVYVRGQAYLRARNGAAAAAEFQKILDHPGVVLNSPLGALAHLGVSRSYALSGDAAKSRAARHDFLTLWNDADPDIPILKEAKAEYAKLQ
jgi:DNA-binding winged helix-turn-helix (wHTH) protein/tetratricopeptide (TPR) repeat protein